LPKPPSTKKHPTNAGARTNKAGTSKTAAARAKGEKPMKKAMTETRPVQRAQRSPADQSAVLNDLAAELRSGDEQISLGAIDRLVGIDDPRATMHLASCLKDSRYIVRIYAAAQLGEKRDASAVDALIGTLHDESLFVRQTVAGALEHIGGDKALRAVKKAEAEGLLLDVLPEGRRLGPDAED